MSLSVPLDVALCLPPDFVNPFLPWRIAPAVCAAVALGAFLVLARVLSVWQRGRMQTLLAVAASVGTLAVITGTALIWGASLSFIPGCGPVDSQEMEYQAWLAQATPTLVYILIGITALLLVTDSALLLRLRGRS